MIEKPPVLQPGPVHLRHVTKTTGSEGTLVLATRYLPSRVGVNGQTGFQSGSHESRLVEESAVTLTFPNVAGPDGKLHRERFEIIRSGRPRAVGGELLYEGGNYRPGDEFIEVYHGDPPGGEIRAVVTPVTAKVSAGAIELGCVDPFWLLKKSRETAAGFWRHAPRDVFEHYTRVWTAVVSEGFDPAPVFTYSESEQTTSDGRWTYLRAENSSIPGQVNIKSSATGAAASFIRSNAPTVPLGLGGAEAHTPWRYEAQVVIPGGPTGGTIDLLLYDVAAAAIAFEFFFNYGSKELFCAAGSTSFSSEPLPAVPKDFLFAIEGRGAWVFYYFAGRLVAVLPMPSVTRNCVPQISHAFQPQVGVTSSVKYLLLRRAVPFLMRGADKGDYRLPGSPPPGGLTGEYFNDQQERQRGYTVTHLLKPTDQPYARRMDPTLNSPSPWPPAGPPGNEYFSARWTGSIYLDLAASDIRLRASSKDRVRIWIGKTRVGEEYINDWTQAGHAATTVTGAMLRATLGSTSGWFPIVIEYSDGAGAGSLNVEREVSGAWGAIPSSHLSPLGIFKENVRFESHHEAATKVAQAFGLQFRTDPKTLESEEFPGAVIPRVRVGRDTEVILDGAEATELGSDISAEDVADTLLADAQGLADPDGGTQLSAEAINFGQVAKHLFILQEYESQAEVASVEHLQQRLTSLLTLKGAPWENVSARPQGARRLVDRFPLKNELAAFNWEAGDGVRLNLDTLGVKDLQPRQMMGVTRSFVPDGLGSPAVSWRQRNRTDRQVLRDFFRQMMAQIRNYQGQLAVNSGSAGGSGLPDTYSRVNLPINLADVVRAEIVVQTKTDASNWAVEVNGTSRLSGIVAPGRYDVTPWVARPGGSDSRMYARMTGGTGAIDYMLELLVRI